MGGRAGKGVGEGDRVSHLETEKDPPTSSENPAEKPECGQRGRKKGGWVPVGVRAEGPAGGDRGTAGSGYRFKLEHQPDSRPCSGDRHGPRGGQPLPPFLPSHAVPQTRRAPGGGFPRELSGRETCLHRWDSKREGCLPPRRRVVLKKLTPMKVFKTFSLSFTLKFSVIKLFS